MDVKMSSYIIFFVCVTLGLQNASATIKEMTLEAADREKSCTTKLTTCRLTIDGMPALEPGEKGEAGNPGKDGIPGSDGAKGNQGIPGFQGAPGERGEKGNIGNDGPQGRLGDKGEKGDRGYNGLQGPRGDKGERGDRGYAGLPGIAGMMGAPGKDGKVGPAGSPGKPGPTGPPGRPGTNGVCPCYEPPNTVYIGEDVNDFGKDSNTPADKPCKSLEPGLKSGTYYMGPVGPSEKPIEVYCNMTSLETCVMMNKKTPVCHHSSKGAPFWLNEMGINMIELYNDTSALQLEWLRERANSVRQTLKYHCLDSVPYSKFNMSSSVKLWAWNDVVIEPYPTNTSPIFYSVSNDECKEGSTEWKTTTIELQSSNVHRLPIVDLWIGDVRHAKQKMRIESVEVCFK